MVKSKDYLALQMQIFQEPTLSVITKYTNYFLL